MSGRGAPKASSRLCPPTVASGLRIGTPAVTTRGLKEPEAEQLSHWIADVLDRTERAMPQAHCFKVMELALKAEAMATRLGNL